MDRLLTRQEIGEIFRVTTRTVDRWTAAGKLRATRLGRKPLYRLEDVKTAVEKAR